MSRSKALLAGLLVLSWAGTLRPQNAAHMITFDVPGSTKVLPAAINVSGVIAGSYMSSNGQSHGFTGRVHEAFASFDPPGSLQTRPSAINLFGAITGSFAYTNQNNFSFHGFVRNRDGSIAVFDPPGSISTLPLEINDRGAIMGSFTDTYNVVHGFSRDAGGAFTITDLNVTAPVVSAINEWGMVTGFDGGRQAFEGYLGGPLLSFSVPGQQFTEARSINSSGAITGDTYTNPTPPAGYPVVISFVRGEDGRISTFQVPGNSYTFARSINDHGAITGVYASQVFAPDHGFVRDPQGRIQLFDASEGAEPTEPTAINTAGFVVGYYADAQHRWHGFLRLP